LRPGERRAVGQRGHPDDPVGVPAADGGRGLDARDEGGGAVRELHRVPAARALPGAVRGDRRVRRPRVHRGSAGHHEGDGRHRRRCRSRLPAPS
jgi:hypothetical protein